VASLQSRIEALEARQRAIEIENEPNCFQRADHGPDGTIIACERLVFPPLPEQRGLTPGEVMSRVQLEPFKRESCVYGGCEHRNTCRADGRPTSRGKRRLEIGALP
jgi:hypothetical protein